MRGIKPLRQPLFGNLQHRHKIKPEKEQIHQVVVGEVFTARMGMDQPQAAQTAACCPYLAQFGDHQAAMVTDYDVLDLTGSVDEQPYLPVQFMGQFAQGPGHLGCDNKIAAHPSAPHPLQHAQVILLQSLSISADPGDDHSSFGLSVGVPAGNGQRARAIELSASSRVQTACWS